MCTISSWRIPSFILAVALIVSASAVHAGDAAGSAVGPLLQGYVDRHVIAGAVTMAVTGDRTVMLEAVGFADIAAQVPMRTDSLFWIASMSKPLTATALMMLVDEGKLSVEDPVTKYLPDFAAQQLAAAGAATPARPPSHPILIRHLLSHTSGLPFLSPVEHGKIDLTSLRDAVSGYAKLPLASEPGSRYSYSNCGINTAGRIIEVVSGMSYEAFMDQRLLIPLRMSDTTCWPSTAQLTRLATSYKPAADKHSLVAIEINYLSYPLDDRKRGPCPGGGYFSTAADLAAFSRMILAGGTLLGHRYISAESLAQMTSKQTGALEARYGFGWQVGQPGTFGHGGAYATDLWIDVPHQLATIYLVQNNGYGGTDGGSILGTVKAAALAE
jgi:CubicO group peptidase (beta-lactamase class C family)